MTLQIEPIPLHRVAIVRPFTQFLADIGAPFERGLRQVKLPVQILDDPNAYVSSLKFWAFARNMARREGIEDLGFRVGRRFGANCGDPHFSTLLSYSPTLYHALKKTCELVEETTSRSSIWLSRAPRWNGLKFCHHASFGADNPALPQMDWYALMAMCGIVQLFAGLQWRPRHIGLVCRNAPVRTIREELSDTRMLTSQPYSYITVESALLSLPPLSPSVPPSTVSASSAYEKTVSREFAGSLKQALQGYLNEGYPKIELAAEICCVSKRSLQRHLANSSLTYSELVEQSRFSAAKELLQNPEEKVTDIAFALGYDSPSNFARAFRRIAGISPREYRRQQLLMHPRGASNNLGT